MGVNPTPTNYKTFTFNGENSRDYGVYITGEGVFNAPERNIEMVEIPGRNGSYALDKGNFNNIEVTYPAGIFADTETDFADAVSELRNFLCSQKGYVRLEDDYNPNEYRLAIYKSGLDVSHDMLIAGEFDITFDCQPQRYLKSGETAVSVTSGDTVTNPTRFASHPMLEVYGYGTIGINGAEIEVEDVELGDVALTDGTYERTHGAPITIDPIMLNNGDAFNIAGAIMAVYYKATSSATITELDITSQTGCSAKTSRSGTAWFIVATFDDFSFSKGTSGTQTCTVGANIKVKKGTTTQTSITVTNTIAYDGDSTITSSSVTTSVSNTNSGLTKTTFPQIFGYSTKPATGTPLYIDLDIGECYNLDFGPAVSANNAVTLPADLPTLASGANTITYDNTVTQLDIVPRWWKV